MSDNITLPDTLLPTSQLKEWRKAINSISDYAKTLAPISHTSETTNYGLGNDTYYGHLKLSDTLSNNNKTNGVAISPYAVKTAIDTCLKKGTSEQVNTITSNDFVIIKGNIIEGDMPNVRMLTTSDSCIVKKNLHVAQPTLTTEGKEIGFKSVYFSVDPIKDDKGNETENLEFLTRILTRTYKNEDVEGNDTVGGYIPLRFDLTPAINEYTEERVSGKMTIGGDLHSKGTISAEGKVYNAVWNDYAEFFERGEETEVGDIIALDLFSEEERYVKASKENPTIVGVHSDTYGYILGGKDSIKESEETHIPVGLVGRVKTKIVGKIKKGEFVVLSNIPGVGCAYDEKLNTHLDVFGVAVESSDDIDIKLVKIKLK